eukprot:COSAG02_NODE_1743_length_11100_cov_17.677575_17_plen_40_part_00
MAIAEQELRQGSDGQQQISSELAGCLQNAAMCDSSNVLI